MDFAQDVLVGRQLAIQPKELLLLWGQLLLKSDMRWSMSVVGRWAGAFASVPSGEIRMETDRDVDLLALERVHD